MIAQVHSKERGADWLPQFDASDAGTPISFLESCEISFCRTNEVRCWGKAICLNLWPWRSGLGQDGD